MSLGLLNPRDFLVPQAAYVVSRNPSPSFSLPHLSRGMETRTLDAAGVHASANTSPGSSVVLNYLHVSHNSNSGLFL